MQVIIRHIPECILVIKIKVFHVIRIKFPM
jgi:hypothetical protein